MKLSVALIAAAQACWAPTPSPPKQENFITSGNVEWELLMDSVMGGISTGKLYFKFKFTLKSI